MFYLLERLHALAVWDARGRQYLPLFGYDGRVEAYAPAREAIKVFWTNHGVMTSS